MKILKLATLEWRTCATCVMSTVLGLYCVYLFSKHFLDEESVMHLWWAFWTSLLSRMGEGWME